MFGTFVESEMERIFLKFLVKEDVYTAFMRNLSINDVNGSKNWNKFKKVEAFEDWIILAFEWISADFPVIGNTKNKEDKKWNFWCGIHNKWYDIIESPHEKIETDYQDE